MRVLIQKSVQGHFQDTCYPLSILRYSGKYYLPGDKNQLHFLNSWEGLLVYVLPKQALWEGLSE